MQKQLIAEGAPADKDVTRRVQEAVTRCQSNAFWEKACLLLQTEYRKACPGEKDASCRIVHACLGTHHCPSSLLEYAILLHPDQLLERDKRGQVPLHIATMSCRGDSIVEIVNACPDAAKMRDGQGNLPLQNAVQRGLLWSEGVSHLLEAHPVALESLDFDERLYPYVWAKFGRDPRIGIDALFESVRAKPHMFAKRQACSASSL